MSPLGTEFGGELPRLVGRAAAGGNDRAVSGSLDAGSDSLARHAAAAQDTPVEMCDYHIAPVTDSVCRGREYT